MLLKLVLAVTISACTLAQASLKPYDATAAQMFQISDINKNGILTLAEVDSNFKSYDSNNDGRITRYEFTSYVDINSPQWHAYSRGLYDIYDVDSNDYLDLHDFHSLHKILDVDADGYVVQSEYVRYFAIVLEALEYLHSRGRSFA